MNIARIIREGREKLNLNQSQLAELIGVSPQAVQQWEAGATLPRGKRLNKIAQVLKLPPALMHFGVLSEGPAAMPERRSSGERKIITSAQASKADAGKAVSSNDPLIDQVVEAMRRMSKEDAARLVTISKALVGEGPAERAEPATDVKALPVPDLAPHPSPAFPARRMSETGPKGRGKTAIR